MTRAIGFRATPNSIHYSIVERLDDTSMKIISIDEVVIPKCLSLPEKLKHIRNNILDVINEYNISYAGVRITEPFSLNQDINRISIEAVIQELFASSCLQSFYVGSISTISKRNKFNRDNFKKYITNEIEYPLIPNFKKYKPPIKEAILTAVGAFNVS